MTAYDREYRELDRLKGVSLKDNVLLYKITPETANTFDRAPESYQWQPIPPHVESPFLRITEAEPGKVGRGLYIALVAAVYVAIPVLLYWLWRLTR